MMKILLILAAILTLAATNVDAEKLTVTIHLVSAEGVGKQIGTIVAEDIKYGLLLTPNLSGAPAGLHGFHVHEHPNCAPAENNGKMTAAHTAGAHYDPAKSGKHLGPYAEGHLGDLPALTIGSDGKGTLPVLAPRLKTSDLKGRALMIHAGGDNYSDQPEPLGGGAGRIACGAVK
jgi:superoxide dismutase, Cu-Zn family